VLEEEIKRRLGGILAKEEGDNVPDWDCVKSLSSALLQEVNAHPHEIVTAYLADCDKRRADAVFALAQRSELLRFLRQQ